MNRPSQALLFRPVLLIAILGLPIAGCSPTVPAAQPAPISSTPAATGTSSTSSTPPASPTRAADPTPASSPRTAAALKKALLELTDLPTGWGIDPSDDGSAQPTFSSADPACKAFVSLGNAAAAPGSLTSAGVSFSGGQDGPFISEGLDALAGPDAVTALQDRIAAANKGCTTVKVTIPGAGSSTVKVQPVSAPQVGTHPTAVRITATGGDLDGLEMTQVTTGIDNTVLSLTFDGAYPEEIEGSSQAAAAKAAQALGATTGTGGI